MIERETKKGPNVKVCTYRGCGIPFSRPSNMKQVNWEQSTRCPKHKKVSGTHRPVEPRLGHYEVKNPILDKFLRGGA